jgi:hypothetical protein
VRWWSAPDQRDLPPDGDVAPKTRWSAVLVRRRRVGLTAALILLALLVVFVGVGVISLPVLLTFALIFGVPLVLSAVTLTVMARRARHPDEQAQA